LIDFVEAEQKARYRCEKCGIIIQVS